MAGIGTDPGIGITFTASARQQFATIAWLRWRIFVNSLRGKGAVSELVVKIFSYPVLAVMILGPAVGAGAWSYYLVSSGMDKLLAIPLWIIFALWQFIGVSTSATGPSFDLSALARFPIRYRDYLLIRLSFGLLDPPTLAGIACLIAVSIGIAFASPALLPWAALALFVYAICNILFSRMLYSWMERWLAQRRTRELLTVVVLVLSVGFQFVGQFAQKFGATGHHAPLSPFMLKTANILLAVNWMLPPGLTASSIQHMHSGSSLIATTSLAGLLLFTCAFLIVLHLRLHAEFLGENLSEAPASAVKATKTTRKSRTSEISATNKGGPFAFLPPTVAACLIKEIRYLLRSGPKLYALIMPVVMVGLFSVRTAGLGHIGRGSFTTYLFFYGCAYTELIFVSLLYNSMGSDGTGVQFYFLAPLRMRDVILAKNIMTGGLLIIEIVLLYIISVVLSATPSPSFTAATLTWTAFAFFLNMSIGNVRSITSPKGVSAGKVRSQNVSGLNSFISLGVTFCAVALAGLASLLRTYLNATYWLIAGVFLVLSLISIGIYILVLGQLDKIASDHAEDLTRELSKA